MMTEIYATVEIRKKELRFVVAKNRNSSITILYKEKLMGDWLSKDDVVKDVHHTSQKLKKIIEFFEKNFGHQIKSVLLILPSKTLSIFEREEHSILNPTIPISKKTINETLSKLVASSQISSRALISVRPFYYKVNGGIESAYQPLGMQSDYILIKAKLYTINKEVYATHSSVIDELKKEILLRNIDMFSLGKACVTEEEFRHTFAVVNWGYENIEIGFYAKESLNRILVLNTGLKTIVEKISKELGVKNKDIEKYLFKLINYSNQSVVDDDLVFRKFNTTKQMTICLTTTEIKKIIYKELKIFIDEIDKRIISEIGVNIMFKTYYFGRVTEIPGFSDILLQSKLKDRAIVFSPYVLGASELWLAFSIGIMLQMRQMNRMNKQMIKTSTKIYMKQPTQPKFYQEHQNIPPQVNNNIVQPQNLFNQNQNINTVYKNEGAQNQYLTTPDNINYQPQNINPQLYQNPYLQEYPKNYQNFSNQQPNHANHPQNIINFSHNIDNNFKNNNNF